MKKYLFFLATSVLIIFSCTKDEVQTINDSNLRKDLRSSEIGINGIVNNGKWLIIKSDAEYEKTRKRFEEVSERYNYDKSDFRETESTFDFEPVLTKFESDLNHKSLRAKNLLKQHKLYSEGLHPKEVMPRIQDYGILDDMELAMLSKDGVVQIGRTIKLYRNNGITILTKNKRIANEILEEGNIAALKLENIKDVEILHRGPPII